MSSAQAVGAVKRHLRQAGYKLPKVGHGGTLDPPATCVLPTALGEISLSKRIFCGELIKCYGNFSIAIQP
jgi:tRNA U55 pseudouridine synthase TruB